MKKITIQELSTPGCSHCKEARRLLEQEIKKQFPNVEIEFIDMMTEKGQQMVMQYGIMASPGIIVNGELFSVGGLDKNQLIQKLKSISE